MASIPENAATKKKSAGLVLFFTILSCHCITAHAAELSLPLKGYFHPGRAMPVQWDVSGNSAGQTIELSASGAITSRIQTAGNPHGIFPWLAIDPNADNMRWQSPMGSGTEFPALHPLDDSDFLVGNMLDDDSLVASLFHGRRQISIHLPDNLEGPAMAWETLDAILFMPQTLAKISPPFRAQLFAAGVEFAVIGGSQPDTALPWRHESRWWIATSQLRFPSTFDSDAYAPTYGWNAGRSADFRLHIFLLGIIYGLLVSGFALWRSRWMPAAIVAASLVAIFVFASENRGYSPIFRRDGIVHLIDRSAFSDHWIYQVSHRDTDFTMPIGDSIHPFFFDASQSRRMNLTLDCGDQGQPLAISGHLVADEPLALMSRQLQNGQESQLDNPPTTPMRLLASDPIYVRFRIRGQITNPESDESWPGIVLRQR